MKHLILIILILTVILNSGISYAFPDKETIDEWVYRYEQMTMKVDIIYTALKKYIIKHEGKEVWEQIILEAGKQETKLKEYEDTVFKYEKEGK